MSCPRPWPLFPEALALLKAGQKPRRSVGAELPRGAQMGKLGPSSAIQQPFCLAAKQPASASLPLTFWALPPSPCPPPGWRKRRVPEPPGLPPLRGVGRRIKDGLQLVRGNCYHLSSGTSPGRVLPIHSSRTAGPRPFVVGPGGCGREGSRREAHSSFVSRLNFKRLARVICMNEEADQAPRCSGD